MKMEDTIWKGDMWTRKKMHEGKGINLGKKNKLLFLPLPLPKCEINVTSLNAIHVSFDFVPPYILLKIKIWLELS